MHLWGGKTLIPFKSKDHKKTEKKQTHFTWHYQETIRSSVLVYMYNALDMSSDYYQLTYIEY